MTSIEKLSLSGVRSFNPDPLQKQTVVFQKPLTIILGKNGAGKTTIIESLLNATTGTMPPGASGADKCGFVYDPRVVGETEVKAQIRLTFVASGGKAMQVIRSFQATHKKTKTAFTSLDATLAVRDDATGEVTSATCRSGDVDRAVPQFLGVSRAVLEHVIFCHQEDCNWPLGSPGDVKKRFDDIFASTRYVEALDKLREVSKGYKSQLKEKESVLIQLREHREQARMLQAEVDTKQKDIELIDSQNKDVDPALHKLRQAIVALNAAESDSSSLQQQSLQLQGRIEERRRTLHEMERDCSSAQGGQTVQQLKALCDDFTAHVTRVAADVSASETEKQRLEVLSRSQEALVSNSRADVRVHVARSEEHAEKVRSLRHMLQRSDETAAFVAGEGHVDGHALLRAEESLHSALVKAKAQREKAKQAASLQVAEASRLKDNALRALDANTADRIAAEDVVSKNTARVVVLRQSVPDVCVDEIEGLKEKVTSLQAQHDTETSAHRDGLAAQHAKELIQCIDEAVREEGVLRKELADTCQDETAVVRHAFLSQEISKRQLNLDSMMQSRVAKLLASCSLEPANSAAAARCALQSFREGKQHALEQTDAEVRQADRDSATLHARVQAAMSAVDATDRKLVERRAVLASAMQDPAPDAYRRFAVRLREAEERHLRAARRTTSLESMAKCYDSFIDAAKREKACVVCKRELSTDQEVQNFVQVNEQRQRTTPDQISRARREQQTASEAVELLKKVAPAAGDIEELEAQLPQQRASLTNAEESYHAQKVLLAELMTKRRDIDKRIMTADMALKDISEVVSAEEEIHRYCAEAKQLEQAGRSGFRPLSAVQKQLDSVVGRIQDLRRRLAEAQSKQQATTTADLSRELQKYFQLLKETEVKHQRALDIRQSIAHVETESKIAADHVTELSRRRVTLTEELDDAKRKEKTALSAAATISQDVDVAVDNLAMQVTTVRECAASVRQYIEDGGAAELERGQAALKAAEIAYAQTCETLGSVTADLSRKRQAVDEQHRRYSQLQNTYRAAVLRAAIESDLSELEGLATRLRKVKDTSMQEVVQFLGSSASRCRDVGEARDLCTQKINEFERRRAQNQGRLDTLLGDINARRAQLSEDKFRGVDKRYQSTFVTVQTVEMAVGDIEKYYRALEKAVSTYHQEKIAQINTIISQLWRTTYRGSDIDTIELRSEDETSGTIARRSYKYRVVMKRGNAELDMRGRCSAGQKVLASVIIRMALSEAFCCDCGILALDEPTTNLDDDNARSLAESLRDLISVRRNVRHFQLIVITHDEEFVRALGSHRSDNFYFVQKDREGAFSLITQRSFGELFA